VQELLQLQIDEQFDGTYFTCNGCLRRRHKDCGQADDCPGLCDDCWGAREAVKKGEATNVDPMKRGWSIVALR
jgi:hypothetical protein